MTRVAKHLAFVASVLGVAALTVACLPPGKLTRNWGRSEHEITAEQVANPAAGEWTDESKVMDGKTVEQVMENYRAEQAERQKVQAPAILNIGTGTQ
jgi:hypothetical protein